MIVDWNYLEDISKIDLTPLGTNFKTMPGIMTSLHFRQILQSKYNDARYTWSLHNVIFTTAIFQNFPK